MLPNAVACEALRTSKGNSCVGNKCVAAGGRGEKVVKVLEEVYSKLTL